MYRLRRRTFEVESALRRYLHGDLRTIVDVGTADGLMLSLLAKSLGTLNLIGIEMSRELLAASPESKFARLQGDALSLPIRSGVGDAVIATAILEHVEDPQKMMQECRRVLRPGGILILTTPDPFMEAISAKIGLLKEAGHSHMFNLAGLRKLALDTDMELLQARKFMFSPIGFPAERFIERWFGPLGLRFIMANQLLVARRK